VKRRKISKKLRKKLNQMARNMQKNKRLDRKLRTPAQEMFRLPWFFKIAKRGDPQANPRSLRVGRKLRVMRAFETAEKS